jgi:hypothetical protein
MDRLLILHDVEGYADLELLGFARGFAAGRWIARIVISAIEGHDLRPWDDQGLFRRKGFELQDVWRRRGGQVGAEEIRPLLPRIAG